MDSALTTVGLPLALAIIMFGLGLDLTITDFKRVARAPKAVAVALACQIVLMPAICFGLVVLFDLPALLGIGMMLLAASPGGTTASALRELEIHRVRAAFLAAMEAARNRSRELAEGS